MDLSSIFSNRQKISSSYTADIFLSKKDKRGKKYIIKESKFSILHEFKVLQGIHHPALVRALGYDETPNDSYIVMEYIEGKNYEEVHKISSPESRKTLLLNVIFAITDMQNYYKFTHYDLHSGNIIVKISTPKIVKYGCHGDDYILKTPFEIKFIDTEYSYLEGVTNDFVVLSSADVLNGVAPNVYDPFFDLSLIITTYCFLEKRVIESINKILDANLFFYYGLPDNDYKKLIRRGFVYGRQVTSEMVFLNFEPLSSVGTYPYYNTLELSDKTPEEFYNETLEYLKNVLLVEGEEEIFDIINETFGDPDRSVYPVEEVRKIVLPLKKEYGRVIRTEKLRLISHRPYSDRDLFNAIVSFFSDHDPESKLVRINK